MPVDQRVDNARHEVPWLRLAHASAAHLLCASDQFQHKVHAFDWILSRPEGAEIVHRPVDRRLAATIARWLASRWRRFRFRLSGDRR
jgi:hypothetical protein